MDHNDGCRRTGEGETKRKIHVHRSQNKDPFSLYSTIREHSVHIYPDVLNLEKGISSLTAPEFLVYLFLVSQLEPKVERTGRFCPNDYTLKVYRNLEDFSISKAFSKLHINTVIDGTIHIQSLFVWIAQDSSHYSFGYHLESHGPSHLPPPPGNYFHGHITASLSATPSPSTIFLLLLFNTED